MTAIAVVAACQKGGISIPAGLFLRAEFLKDTIAKAESCAQCLYTHSPVPDSLPSSAPSLISSHLLEARSLTASPEISVAHSEISGYDSSSSSSSCDAGFTTPESAAVNLLLCDYEQGILSAKDLLDRIDTTDWTESQLLLLQETCNNQDRNILTIQETYTGELDAQNICTVWINTILAEPIFQELIIDLDIPPHELLVRRKIEVENEEYLQIELHNALLASGALSQLTVVQSTTPSVTVIWRLHHAF